VPSTPSGDPCTHAAAAAGTACGDPSSSACNGPDACDGAGACSPNLAPDGTLCGDTGTACTNQDACLAGACHDNGFQPAGTACGDPSSGACDAPDSCDGAGACSPNHAPDGTLCGDAGTACVNQDTCAAGLCQDNGFAPAGTACGDPSSGPCDSADACDSAGLCSSNHAADGTLCDDGNACTAGTTCTTGVCGGGSPVPTPPVNDSVVFEISGTKLTWNDPAPKYSVYRGKRFDGVAFSYDHVCFDPRTTVPSAIDTNTPALGSVFYYLVTRYDACGESIPGSDSDGHPIPNALPCP
jgi:hypothetical protein